MSATDPITVQIPLASEDDRQGGWTISTDYLGEIQRQTNEEPCWEAIEEVLCIALGITPNPLAKHQAEDDDYDSESNV